MSLSMTMFSIIVIFLSVLYVFLCPFSKVEESFNMQATHDLLYFGNNIQSYDHLEFPGVVPRTFIGPIAVIVASSPFWPLLRALAPGSKFAFQLLARAVLGLLVVHALIRFANSASYKFGRAVGPMLLLITASQFHFLFYSSRTLPNTFALVLCLHACTEWLYHRHYRFITLAGAAVMLFRSELASFFFFLLVLRLMQRKITIFQSIACAVPAALVMLAGSVLIDSYFWRSLLWPELRVFYFNAVLNKSHEWGTQPLLWYFYSVLPRLMMFSTPFLAIAVIRRVVLRGDARQPAVHRQPDGDVDLALLSGSATLFVLLYSLLPHKELRFVIYTLPIFNLDVAYFATQLFSISRYTRWENNVRPLV
jgi:alpha-1,6-mannosyltransferase